MIQVRVGRDGSCAQYGMVAVEDVTAGECLFEIPRNLLLSPETSKMADIIRQGEIRSDERIL